MKRVFFLFFMTLIMAGYGFSQNNLAPDQIRRHANELGVPYEDLQRLIDSHRAQTGLSNPNANGAQLLSSRELNFMLASDMLTIGSYYRVRTSFSRQEGRRVILVAPDNDHLIIDASFLVNLPQWSDITVDVLIGVRANQRQKELFLVEIALAQ
jgi:hypothetical protein